MAENPHYRELLQLLNEFEVESLRVNLRIARATIRAEGNLTLLNLDNS